MRERAVISAALRPAVAVSVVGILIASCSGGANDADQRDRADSTADTAANAIDEDASGAESADTTADSSGATDLLIAGAGHAETIETLVGLLPPDTRGVFAVDLGALLTQDSSAPIEALLNGGGTDPALSEVFGAVGALAGDIATGGEMSSALLGQTTDAAAGLFLLAALPSGSIDDVMVGAVPTPVGTRGPASQALYQDASGNHLTLFPDGALVVGDRSVVESVIDVSGGVTSRNASAIVPYLDALEGTAHVGFVYGMPTLFDGGPAPDRTLRGAAVVSGAFDVADGDIAGTLAFHTANAAGYVDLYNNLNRHATQGAEPAEQPLTLADPIAEGLDQIVLTIPAGPLDPTPDAVVASRNVFKKLIVGMEAHDYADRVADRSEAAWLELLVKSERDEEPAPGSVFIRWEFRDQAAIEAFEANELPAGFELAPTRFLESDDPEGEYFLALNVYDAGSSIVSGARAEWDVFVQPPVGADPDAGERPRFMVVDALAEEVSADPVNLLTPAEPVSHELVDDIVVTRVRRFEDDREVPVFEATFPRPDSDVAEVARFTREMAIGNDYIYWGHGVFDRALYNATTFNHDAYFVDTTRLTVTDDSRWAQYLKPVVKDAVYYVNSLEYVASPMANLDSDHLDITPEWLAELIGFTTNGHQEGLMRKAVEQLFRGEADALVASRLENESPATFFHFDVVDPDALSAALDLPPGHRLAPTTLFEGGDEQYYLTLSVYEVEDSIEGTRAEWSVYTDDGDGRPPSLMILDVMTADVGFDPVSIINLPSEVRHDLTGGVVSTRLSSGAIEFVASFSTAGATDEALSLDWIEAGDVVCRTNGICDKFYYDAETLDVPVRRPADVTVDAFSTPWSAFVSATPSSVFYRVNAQQYVVNRWHNLDVLVDELPFGGLEGRTHTISGSGTLVGRDSDVANSDYVYTGDAVLDGDRLNFALDQRVENALGVGHIFTTGDFDLRTGTGTQTVADCQGPALLCSDIENGSTAFYTAQDLDASDLDAIEWQVNVVVDLGGSFGAAESTSRFVARRDG